VTAPRAVLEGPLAEALSRGRLEYNARVVNAKRSGAVDDGALLATLRGLDAVVRAAHACDRARTDTVVSALFDAALELLPRGIVGPGARRPEVQALWVALLAAAPRMVCADPSRVVAATMNALTRLADCGGARPSDWAEVMATLSERAADVEAWLKAGVVAAWRSGLAHARAGALDACARVPVELSSLALGLDGATAPEVMSFVVERARADPWAWPPHLASGQQPMPGIKFVGNVGGFRGFGRGGRFIAPPCVGLRDGIFVVSDGERSFELHADFFGATITPIGPAVAPPHGHGAMVLGEKGDVRHGDLVRVFAGLTNATSWASTDVTLAAARDDSHVITLVALSGYGA